MDAQKQSPSIGEEKGDLKNKRNEQELGCARHEAKEHVNRKEGV